MSCELGEKERVAAGGDSCERDEHECVTQGAPLHWPSGCLTYAVQEDGSANAAVDAVAFQQAIADAFAAWEAVPCPGGGSPRFHAQFQGYVGCARRDRVCGTNEQNVNVMMFHDDNWPGETSEIGLTTPFGGISSGLVVDADLELNSRDHAFSLRGTEPGTLNLADVLAHEVGHFLGLAHSDADAALMSRDYASVSLSPELFTADDIAAICATYPPGPPLDCGEPPAPAYYDCDGPQADLSDCKLASMTHDSDDGGCSFGAARPERGGAALGLLLAMLVGARRRRRRASVGRAAAPLSPARLPWLLHLEAQG